MGNPSEKQMDVNALKGIVFSDFNPSNFCGCLNRSEGISAVLGSEGEIGSQLLAVQKRSEIYDFAVTVRRK